MLRTLHIADTEYLWAFAFITFTFVLKFALLVLKFRSPSPTGGSVYEAARVPAVLLYDYLFHRKNQMFQPV